MQKPYKNVMFYFFIKFRFSIQNKIYTQNTIIISLWPFIDQWPQMERNSQWAILVYMNDLSCDLDTSSLLAGKLLAATLEMRGWARSVF